MTEQIEWDDFQTIELRAGTVERVEPFPEARDPAYKLFINFGKEPGIKKSSAQITDRYDPEELVGTQVLAVTNVPPKQIANFISEVLVTGFVLDDDSVVLARPDEEVPDGTPLA